MIDKYVLNDYFEWLYYNVVNGSTKKYKKLLSVLHSIEFTYSVDYDENRASDGENLRWYYVCDGGDDAILKWEEPCTVLEMLIATAMHMDDITGESNIHGWFWMMLDNLDLAWMTNAKYNKNYIYEKVTDFMDRKYEPDGHGNVFCIPECKDDLREVEIWIQMCWYLDTIL